MRTSFERKKDFLLIVQDTDTLLNADGTAMDEKACHALEHASLVADIVIFARQGLNTKLFMPLCGKITFLHMQQTTDKSVCIDKLLAQQYIKTHVLAVGAFAEDAQSAEKSGVLYYSSGCGWNRLIEEAIPKFLHGTYAGSYNTAMLNKQK